MNQFIDIIATVNFYSTKIGGRSGPTPDKVFRCPLVINNKMFDCALLLEETGPIAPGDTKTIPIVFIRRDLIKDYLFINSSFKLWELKIIADGVINNIFDRKI